MLLLRQSTAVTVKIGPFTDSTDGNTDETGLTISQADVRLSKNGGNMAQKNEASSCTHDEIGQYDCDIDATDTNTLGRLKIMVHEAGALPVWNYFMVITQNAYDALVAGSDVLEADLTQMGGVAQSAVDLKDFADTGYDPVAHDVETVKVATAATDITNGVTLAADAIKAVSYDESTAFPLKADDAAATQIARVGADGDTLETLSDQIDLQATASELVKVPASDGTATWNANADNALAIAALAALNTYDPPTKAELDVLGTAALATATALATHDGKLDTAQIDLDKLTGTDGATLATAQSNYAPNKIVPDAAGVVPTAVENRQEMDSNSTRLERIRSAVSGRFTKSGNVYTFYKDDDTSPLFTGTITTIDRAVT